MNKKLSSLKKLDLRKVWKHEALDFTKWLAKDENIRLLSDEIGIDIQVIQVEANVGNFNVDILAEEENTNRKIIIENQLEVTNHSHLGQIITYASGLEASIIIWVVKDVRDEHKQAIDWLNEHTDSDINFFVIKIELWQIGNSAPAPKFQVVSKPNEWGKLIKDATNKTTLTKTKLSQLEFWQALKIFYEESSDYPFKLRLPRPQQWYDISIGTSEAHISLIVNTQKDEMRCELYINESQELYEYLKSNKSKIENEIGIPLLWISQENKKARIIRAKYDKPFEFDNKDKWETYFLWLLETATKFYKTFPKYIRKVERK